MKRIKLYFIVATLLFTYLFSAFSIPVFAASEKETTPSGIHFDDLENEIGRFMEKHIDVSSPGAAVAIVKNGEIIFSGAYGTADKENNTPVEIDTVFEIGSISKLFVWVSVMQLEEQGKIDLDADIRSYLPEEFNQKWKTQYTITMRNIMNHASGYGEYVFDLIAPEISNEPDLANTILNVHPNQYFEPGTASSYSNNATALAGYVVECISGQKFYQYQKENIFDQIGMNQTAGHPFWLDNIDILKNKAQGYTRSPKGDFLNTGWSHVDLYPAGSINGTVEDLAKFIIALMPADDNGSPLFQNPDTISAMLSPSYSDDTPGTAHGFFEFDSATESAFGHGGNTISFSSQLVFVPREQFGIVVMTNTGSEYAITYGLHDFLIGNKTVEKIDSDLDLPDAHDLTGSYVTMRRSEKTSIEFSSYLPSAMGKIQAIDNHTIEFQWQIFSGTYMQTAPYVFELIESSNPALKVAFNKLEFKMENGVPVQIMVGKGMDFSAFPSHRTPVKLAVSVITLIVSVLFFLAFPIALMIMSVRRKKKNIVSNKKFNRAHTVLTLSGTALLLNNVVLILLIAALQMRTRYSQVFPFGIVNYVLVIISIISLIIGMVHFRKQTSKAQKIWFMMTGVILVSFIFQLVNWNMFILYI